MSSSFNGMGGLINGQQPGQGSGMVSGYGNQGMNPPYMNTLQLGQRMRAAMDTFNSWLASMQRQLGNGLNQNPGSMMGMPQGMMNTLQGIGGQAGRQLGQMFGQNPGMVPKPSQIGNTNQMASKRVESSGQIGSTLNLNQGARRPNEQ